MTKWPQAAIAGLAGGGVVNAIEWIAHRVWLDPEWTRAFAALGRPPMGWSSFVVANFLVPGIAIWTYSWLGRFYGRTASTAVRTAALIWIVFWVIPMLGMQPMNIIPNYLLAMVILVGALDGIAGILPAIWLYERLTQERRP